MSIASLTSAATTSLTYFLYKTCTRKTCTQTVTGEVWADSATFLCMYEESSSAGGGELDYQGTADGYDLWVLPNQTLAAGDKITVDGYTLMVTNDQEEGRPGPLKKVTTRKVAV